MTGEKDELAEIKERITRSKLSKEMCKKARHDPRIVRQAFRRVSSMMDGTPAGATWRISEACLPGC
jgi:hypothetical protein